MGTQHHSMQTYLCASVLGRDVIRRVYGLLDLWPFLASSVFDEMVLNLL